MSGVVLIATAIIVVCIEAMMMERQDKVMREEACRRREMRMHPMVWFRYNYGYDY